MKKRAERFEENMKKETQMQENDRNEQAESVSKKAEFRKELFSWIRLIVIAVLLSQFLTRVVLVNRLVPTNSMESLILPGDRVFGSRFSYLFSDPERFDVVIFKYPVDEEQDYIKRVIGLPGETVTIENAKIYINDSEIPLKENYLPEKWVVENDGYRFEVPEDSYLMLGDNRNLSLDARYWAEEAYLEELVPSIEEGEPYMYVSRDQILGKAICIYWPNFQILSDYEENVGE